MRAWSSPAITANWTPSRMQSIAEATAMRASRIFDPPIEPEVSTMITSEAGPTLPAGVVALPAAVSVAVIVTTAFTSLAPWGRYSFWKHSSVNVGIGEGLLRFDGRWSGHGVEHRDGDVVLAAGVERGRDHPSRDRDRSTVLTVLDEADQLCRLQVVVPEPVAAQQHEARVGDRGSDQVWPDLAGVRAKPSGDRVGFRRGVGILHRHPRPDRLLGRGVIDRECLAALR